MQNQKEPKLNLTLSILAILLLVSFLFGCKGDLANPAEGNWDNVRATGEGVIFEGYTEDGRAAVFLKKNTCYYEAANQTFMVMMRDDRFELRNTDGTAKMFPMIWGPMLSDGILLDNGLLAPRSSSIYHIADAIFKFYGKGPYESSTYGSR